MTTPTPHRREDAEVSVDLAHEGDATVLSVAGKLVIGEAWRIRELDVEGFCSPLTIDLSEVTELDLAGVAAVTDIARRMMHGGRGVQIIAPASHDANRTAKMTGMLELINRQSPVAFALAS